MADIVRDPPSLGTSEAGPPAQGPKLVEARVPDTIVPIPALVVAGVVFAALIVTIATDEPWALEFFHVAGGGIWTAMDLFLGLVLGPILGTMSISSRIELTRRLMPKVAVIMPVVVTCTLAAGWQLGRYVGAVDSDYIHHGWIVASYIIVGVLTIVALGILEPANIAVLFELRKPEPDGVVISILMKRFVYTAGIIGVMQVATLVIMTKIASGA